VCLNIIKNLVTEKTTTPNAKGKKIKIKNHIYIKEIKDFRKKKSAIGCVYLF
jgi:hypothetical protein